MVFFSNSQGTNVQIVADPVNQGSVNANEVIFAGPFAPSNTVTVTYRTPGGISLTPRILSLVDGSQIIDGVEYNAWTGLLDAAVTEFAGTVTAMFSVTASEGTTIVTNPAYFEVREGVYIEPPADPSSDVWGQILTALTTVKESVDNLRKDTDGNTASITALDSVVSSHSTQIAALSSNKLDKQTGETANHMVYAKTPEGAQEMLPFPSGTIANIKDGEPVGSLEQLGSDAQGEYDTALGTDNTTGVKGYYIAGVYFSDNQTIFVLDYTFWPEITVVPTAPVPDEETPTPEWAANDVALFTFSRDVTLTAPIQNVDHNLLYIGKNLEYSVPTTRVTEERSNSNSVCVPSKPTVGYVKLTNGGASTGAHNVAAGNNATVSGEGNIAGGDWSDVGGVDCAGYATGAFVRGIGNEAKAPYMAVFGMYAENGRNGIGSVQADEQIRFRVGAGKGPGARSTAFAIDKAGTTTMKSASVTTGSIVSRFNVINKEYADNRYSRNGIGNTTTYDGQFVTGKYSKTGQNGLSSDQTDNQLIVRIGAGSSASSPRTVFSIDDSGTTCMSKGAVKTVGIVDPWNVINKEYADAHYAPIGGGAYASAVSSKNTTHILPKESTVILVGPSGAYATFDASSGMYKFTNYRTVFEMKASTFVTNGATDQHEFFFAPAYATTNGGPTTYYTPVYWYSEGTAAYCDANGTANANGAFVKVTSKMHYVVKS